VSEPSRGSTAFWRVSGLVLLVAVVAAVLHLHERLSELDERLDGIEGDLGRGAGGQVAAAGGDGEDRGRAGASEAGIRGLVARLERLESVVRLLGSGARDLDRGGAGEPDGRSGQRGGDRSGAYLAAAGRDERRYDARSLKEIENLYRRGNERIDTEEGRDALEELVEKYPESNRRGCAAMNLGATYLNEGELEAAAAHLEAIISAGSDAVFENGERILPKAMYNYGMLLERRGDEDGARDVWEGLGARFPGETDGNGIPYAKLVEGRGGR